MSSPSTALHEVRESRETGPVAGLRKVETGRDSEGDPPPPNARFLPLDGPLRPLLPEGVRPGSTVAVAGSTALALTLTAGLAAPDRWVAGLGWDRVGLLAAHELGVPWERLVLVTTPADPRQRSSLLAAAVEAFDVVVAYSGHQVDRAVPRAQPMPAVDARRIQARARQRGAVLVVAGNTRWWPEPAEVQLQVADSSWHGLGQGHGHLRARQVTVEATGRGRLVRPRRLTLWLPSTDGRPDGRPDDHPTDQPVLISESLHPARYPDLRTGGVQPADHIATPREPEAGQVAEPVAGPVAS